MDLATAFLWMTLRWLLKSADGQDRLPPPDGPGDHLLKP